MVHAMPIVFSYLSGKHTVSACFELEDMIKLGEDFSSLSLMYSAKVAGLVVLLDNIDCQQNLMPLSAKCFF